MLDLAQEAEARNLIDRGNKEDLASWIRIGAATVDTASDGVPEYAFGPRKRGGKAPIRDFAGGRLTVVADRDAAEFESRPNLALLSLGYGPKGPRTPRRPVHEVLDIVP